MRIRLVHELLRYRYFHATAPQVPMLLLPSSARSPPPFDDAEEGLPRAPVTQERLIAHARDLATLHGNPGVGGRDRLLRWLDENANHLAQAIEVLTTGMRAGRRLPPAALWLLDNRVLIREQIAAVRRHLPRSYSRWLPLLRQGSVAGLPRVLVLARNYIAHVDGRLDPDSLLAFIEAYQESHPLLLGELWATPIMLRLGLIANLARLGRRVADTYHATVEAERWAQRLIVVAEERPAGLVTEVGVLSATLPEPPVAFIAELHRLLRGHPPVQAVIGGWLDARRESSHRPEHDEDLRHTRAQANDQLTAEVTITSMRHLDEVDWRSFVESASVVERELQRDPAGIHPRMDDATRDAYRHAVEILARRSRRGEPEVAHTAVRLAEAGHAEEGHTGHWLLGAGRRRLESELGLRGSLPCVLAHWQRRYGEIPFIAAVVLGSLALGGGLLALAWPTHAPWWLVPVAAAIAVTAASRPVVHLSSWLLARLLTPQRLPRLDFSDGISASQRTLVVVPTMLRQMQDGAALAEGLELRWLANRDPALRFALLTDFGDAPVQEMPEETEILDAVRQAIAALNERHGSDGSGPFLLLHRPRGFNAAEGCWMGWERKRGKLEHLNALIRHGDRQHFSVIDGDAVALQGIRYVIVLDTDTQLPPGAARRLVATMAHPLMHPHIDSDGVVRSGHALLQPKVLISSASAVRSRFARMSAPEPGIDPYSGVSADLWQDLCDQGSFVGKGIYDVAAFERVLNGRFPTNTILSHDLIEGCYTRAGLVSDVALVEDQPASLLADRARRHRWMRGDWQIAAWLMPWVRDAAGRRQRNPLGLLARWKILDNLRRALVPPAVLALVGGDLLLGSGGWASLALLTAWLLTPVIAGVLAIPRRAEQVRWRVHLDDIGQRFVSELAGLGLTVVLLPAEALLSLHAMSVALWRSHVSGRRRLEWLTSSESERLERSDLVGVYHTLWSCPLAGVLLLALVAVVPDLTLATQVAGALLAITWLLGPVVAWWLSRPLPSGGAPLRESERELVALTARATWRWFETFVTEQDHWLPPDNVQEQPVALVAHRTSPTNIGMALLADLAANDLGFLPTAALVERCGHTLDTLDRLERHRGHFLNWYDTRTLDPMAPRYISTVDSGNLAGALLVLAQGLQALGQQVVDPARVLVGLRATALGLAEACHASPETHGVLGDVRQRLGALPTTTLDTWLVHFSDWLATQEPAFQRAGDDALWWLRALVRQAKGWAAFHRDVGWNDGDAVPLAACENARRLIEQAHRLAARAAALVEGMDFRPLYQQRRRLFAIGMQVEDGRVDRGCYDLLASEARLTSYLAVARGQVPLDHWFTLGRPLVDIDGNGALVSWSGSMFEYLMPDLLMPEYPDTLLAGSQRAMLARQIAYGKGHGVPWGISESGYHLTDAAQQWQYRGFGVPGLGLKQGLAEDLVISPYATALALLVDPRAAARNLQRLYDEGVFARYGFYEAVDYTPTRLPPGSTRALVRSWMAHHQGMTLLACVHVLAGAPMRARFHADPNLRALELLLQERAPQQPPFEDLEKEPRPLTTAEEAAGAFVVTNPHATHPEATLLSNGRYHVLITAGGGGVSRWNGLVLNRWHEDPLNEAQGLFCWLHDVERGHRWSVTHQPAQVTTRTYEVVFTQSKAEFRHRINDIECICEISLANEDDIELRRITLVNHSGVPRTIELTTAGELVVGSAAADIAHQAFSGLGLATRFDAANETLYCHRRPRRSDESVPVAIHLMTVHGAQHSPASVETDRTRFIGRGRDLRSPAAIDHAGPLAGCVALPLDGVAALRRRIQLPPEMPVVVDVVWGLAEDQVRAEAMAARYRERALTDRVAGLAWAQARLLLHQLGIDEETAQAAARLVAALATVSNAWRAPAGVVALNRRAQSALWAHGISGDLPILLLRIADLADLEVARDCLGAYNWWRAKGMPVDVVLWNDDPTAYRQDLHERLAALVEQANPLDGKPGTVVLRHADQVGDDDRIALFAAARVVLDAAHGAFLTQAARRPRPLRAMERLTPPRSPRSRAMAPAAIPTGLSFLNGLGGFAENGTYVIVLDPSAATPAPWINVLANEHFGALISASGASCTWDINCHEFRLTPWPNDNVGERCGEALYLRDEEDGGYWSPSPWPAPAPARYVVRHGFGMTSFTCHHDDIISEMTTFVAANEPVRVWRWRITNRGERMRRLSVTWCAELVLGEQRRREAPYIITTRDPLTTGLVAHNPHHPDLARRHVAVDVNLRTRTVSGDRKAVLGRNRGWDRPEAMLRTTLDGNVGAALDPCLAMQAPCELAPGQMREVVFVLACGDGMAAAETAARWCTTAMAGSGQAEVAARWEKLCGGVQVSTPDRALDLLLNRWLPYQTIACRLWARGAWYQSGGAIGFRDQLQDAMALVHLDPGLLRAQILLAASRQFQEGDVQHWWHPPAGRGVRTRCSDDLLWLPAAVVRYIEATGDRSILDQEIPFLSASRELPPEGDLYEQPLDSGERASLYEHCLRAITRAQGLGAHGLPLIGSGDWNDGFDRLGHHGRGESVWLAFFLHHVIEGFLPHVRLRGSTHAADELATWNRDLLQSADAAWDGMWYRRAYDDEGRPIGSAPNTACRIDSLPQSWAVIAGAPDAGRARMAMAEVERQLIDREHGIVRLFTPPFGEHDGDPGYIRGYPDGVRENGGQYTHAAVWVAFAFARMGDAKRAWEVVRLLDPIRRGADPHRLEQHRTEPYVLCGDVYGVEPWTGRGGWSWYTGSAGWLYRTLVEELLGIRLVERHLVIEPLMPEDWSGFTLTYRRGATTWNITITRGEQRTVVDGTVVEDHRLVLNDDGGNHQVEAVRRGIRNPSANPRSHL